jgi:uncharacterized membrane protein
MSTNFVHFLPASFVYSMCVVLPLLTVICTVFVLSLQFFVASALTFGKNERKTGKAVDAIVLVDERLACLRKWGREILEI